MRTMYGVYPEYHTSADNKDFISFEALEESVKKYLEVVHLMEYNKKYVNQLPNCEPQLGKRGLYPTLGSQKDKTVDLQATIWILNLSDGEHDLIDIIELSKIDYRVMIKTVKKLLENGIIK